MSQCTKLVLWRSLAFQLVSKLLQAPARPALMPSHHKLSLQRLTTRSLTWAWKATQHENVFSGIDFWFLSAPTIVFLIFISPCAFWPNQCLTHQGDLLHFILSTMHQLIINQTQIKPIFPSSSLNPLIAHYPVLCSDTKVILLSGEFCCCFFFHKNC